MKKQKKNKEDKLPLNVSLTNNKFMDYLEQPNRLF